MNKQEELIEEHSQNISREIKESKKNELLEQKSEGNEVNLAKTTKCYKLNTEVQKQRINNTFAMASKNLKNMVADKWNTLTDYLLDLKYKEIAGSLKDATIGVVSDKNILLVTKYESLIDKIYSKISLCEELINKITNMNLKIVIILESDFQKEVNNYKSHLADKNYYTYQEETEDMITYQEEVYKEPNLCYGNLVKKAIDVFGSDYVEVE